jgi:hypothetical protein
MIVRSTAALLAFVLASLPLTSALAQPVPAQPDKPLPDKPAPDKPQPDKPQPDKPETLPVLPEPDKPAPVAATGGPQPQPVVPVAAPPVAKAAILPILPPEPGAAARADHPVSFSSDGFTIWPRMLVQVQVTPFVGENASFVAGDIAERPGFRLRRGRFGFGADYKSLLKAEIAGELSSDPGSSLTLHDAWIGVTPKSYLGAYMGVLDVPFSRSALTSSSESTLIDRPLAVRAMAPMQQLGALISGSVAAGRFQYAAGVFNGFQRSDVFYSGYSQSLAALGNRFDNLAYAVRLAAAFDTAGPDIPEPGNNDDLINLGASYFFSDGGARDIHSVEGDLLFRHGGFRLLGEVLYSVTAPESVPTQPTVQNNDITAFGAVVEAGYTVRRSFGGHLRLELINPNTAVEDASDNWLLTVGLSFAPPVVGKYAKAQLEYTHREEIAGKSLANDSITLQTQFVLQ